MDLVIRNARLADRPGDEPLDIGVQDGRIVAIERCRRRPRCMTPKGLLACPGLIESHIHLDKSRIVDRCAPQPRHTLEPAVGTVSWQPPQLLRPQ